MTRSQKCLLIATYREVGNLKTLSPKQAPMARALERRALGTYTRTDEYLAFKLNAEGRKEARRLLEGT